MEVPKKPGRPPKLGVAMSGKQRAAMYRTRRYEAACLAHEDLTAATTPVLLAALTRQLKSVADAEHADVARIIAAQIIRELCDRHEIRLTHGYVID